MLFGVSDMFCVWWWMNSFMLKFFLSFLIVLEIDGCVMKSWCEVLVMLLDLIVVMKYFSCCKV